MKDNTQQKRFELEVENKTVFANYRLDENKTPYINYVEAPESLRGTGAAGKLMEEIMQFAKSKDCKVIPICGYAVSWIRRHAEYQDFLR